MGDENATFVSGGYMFRASDDGEWENLGYVDEGGVLLSADSGDDELDKWHEMLLSLSEPVSFELKLPWYMTNEWYRIFTGRYRYSVRSLRRENKGHRRNRHAGRN